MIEGPTDSPRPSSLRALAAWFFVLSFGDYPDGLKHGADKHNDGTSISSGEQSPFERRMRQLIWWPPDIFALTSTILARTGAYRMVVGPDPLLGQNLWQRLDWQPRVEAHAEAWRSVISELILQPLPQDKSNSEVITQIEADTRLREKLHNRVKDRCARRHLQPHDLDTPMTEGNLIETFLHRITTLEDRDGLLADQNLLAVSVKADRRNRPGAGKSEENAALFFEAIIGLHILADAAAGSIGVPRSSTKESAVFDAFANILLTLRGSLSTVSKFHGVVLPKMRTPQTGLTLRNLSHNLTFHVCEVEVMWRSFPWANFDENTLNVLYVPYPFDFDPNRFQSDTDHYESVGYFTYDPGDWKEIGSVVDLIEEVRKEGTHPHMLVFSETAFNEDSYKRLLTALSHRYGSDDPRRMPVVVAGVARYEHDQPYNELRLATYFAGKWYQLAQHKHHRWQLNESQIKQYGLQGRLSTARPLFERSIIDQRRLTFYAPTPWLVLSPLICEDLSRIEPVSELIRGVGPTLVLALLLDGPQLAERWPSRYASVLADDPGTGVLTVTSYGAAKASKPASAILSTRMNAKNDQPTGSEEVVVASWKDASSSFQKLSVSDRQALLVTLTANMGEEYTLDRRRETGKAAGFRLVGTKTFDVLHTNGPHGIDTGLDLGNWSDIREVTALTYVASAALSLLRPHQSRHPTKAGKYTDMWDRMHKWNIRCQRVRQLIDIMLGRPVFKATRDWEQSKAQEKENLKRQHKASQHEYFTDLKVTRNVLLNHIFDHNNGQRLTPNRHLFAVLCFAQSTIDVEVRDEEAIWPTASLIFGATVLRILFDSIAGIHYEQELDLKDLSDAASEVYRSRLKIAGWANRNSKRAQLWDGNTVKDGERDVIGAPQPLIIPGKNEQSRGHDEAIGYLLQFERQRQPHSQDKLLGAPTDGTPTRYDFYRMTLELIDAILADEQASLWIRCQKIFNGSIGKTEMRRLTLLVLMMVPALIHEQLEFDHIRLKRTYETGMNSNVMHELMKKSEEILLDAARKTGTRWNPQKPR